MLEEHLHPRAPTRPQLAPEAVGALVAASHRRFSHADEASTGVGLAGAVTGDLAEEYHEASKARQSFPQQMLGPGGPFFATVPDSAFSVGWPSLAQSGPAVPLPAPGPLPVDLDRLAGQRRSALPSRCSPLRAAELATVLGLSARADPRRPGRRVYPSAGALFPIDVVAIIGSVETIDPGCYVYDPRRHALLRRGDLDPRALHEVASIGEPIPATSVTFALVATFARTRAKYGLRGYRFALLEAGHLAQALILHATALGLHTLPWGGFFDGPVDESLDLDGVERSCVYLVAVSREAST